MPGPYHDGELEAQRRAGSTSEAAQLGPMIGDRIPVGALRWIASQTLVVAATADGAGRPWASPWFGEPGFVVAPSADRLVIDLARADRPSSLPSPGDAGDEGRIALLVIELSTRRRLRIAGAARRVGDRLEVSVRQAYPNCPKYIHRRVAAATGGTTTPSKPPRSRSGGSVLDDAALAQIAAADTFFIASAGADGLLDVSHRGGPPGFVVREPDGALVLPDYSGNGMFNTLGNLLRDPRAGLAFVDFAAGRTLQIAADAEVSFGDPDDRREQAGRSLRLLPVEWRRSEGVPSRPLVLVEPSPFVEWEDAPPAP